MTLNFRHALLAEAAGTAVLLAIVVGSGIMGEKLAQGNLAIALLANSIATGAGLYVLISALGPISGAHFNPAVTTVMWWRGEVSIGWLASYIGVQVIGAIVGVWIAHAMFDLPVLQVSIKVRTGAGQWISEAIATSGLLATILMGLRTNPKAIPALVGSYITVAYWFTASTSFANPAVTIARSLTDTFAGIRPADVLGFISAQVAGTITVIGALRLLGGRRDVAASPAHQPSSSGATP